MKTKWWLILVYLTILISSHIGMAFTTFLPPKGLWNLVPFRVGGWQSYSNPNKIYKVRWLWGDILKAEEVYK